MAAWACLHSVLKRPTLCTSCLYRSTMAAMANDPVIPARISQLLLNLAVYLMLIVALERITWW